MDEEETKEMPIAVAERTKEVVLTISQSTRIKNMAQPNIQIVYQSLISLGNQD